MIAVAALWFVVLGLPAGLLLDREMTPLRLLGSAFLLGGGIVSLILLALPVWTLPAVTAACAIVALAAGAPAWRQLIRRGATARTEALPGGRGRMAARVVDACTLGLVLAHASFATAARVGVWDFFAIWGLKARVFLEHGGIDWAFLEHPYHLFSHPDYPPLVTLDYVFVALHQGGWNDRHLGILTTLFALAVLLIVRDCFAEELPPLWAALATFGVASIPLVQWIGMAEAPMIAYGTAALLTIRRGSLTLGAVLLGFATMTKNEGVSLAAAVAVALLLGARRRELARLWPAAVIAAPWLILRALHVLPTDLASGDVLSRSAHNLPHVLRLLGAEPPEHPVYWIACLAALAIFPKSLKREQFVLTATLIQLLFFIGAYIVTPNDLRWHIDASWLRLLDQIAVPLGFTALVATGR